MNNVIKTIKEKIKGMTEEGKVVTLSGLFISLILVVGLVGISLASPNSTILNDREIEGLKITEANLEYIGNESVYTAKITNTNDNSYNLKYINIDFFNENEEKTTLIGYIGESIEKNETKLIKASIDKDITNSTKLEYSIVK